MNISGRKGCLYSIHQGEVLSLQELWPSEKTWRWFERAARCGNVEASIKLVVALLYNEGGEEGEEEWQLSKLFSF